MKFKTTSVYLIIALISSISYAQIGIGTSTPDASAVLDLSSTTKGLLMPRMTTLQQSNLVNPAIGLMVYNTTTNQIETNKGNGLGSALWAGASTNGTTATIGTNTTQLATTEFVISNSNKYIEKSNYHRRHPLLRHRAKGYY